MTDSNRHVVCCSDVIDEPVVCQKDTRKLIVHEVSRLMQAAPKRYSICGGLWLAHLFSVSRPG